jgi:protein-disulfide isomerase/ketosteroid isomerase-like protein
MTRKFGGHRSRIAFSALLLCAFAANAPAQVTCATCSTPSILGGEKASADPRSAEVQKLDGDLDRARLAGDKAAIDAAFADEILAVDGTGEVSGKKQLLAEVRPPDPARKVTLSASNVEARLFGETAIVTSMKHATWERNGRPHSDDYRETNTYVRRKGRWVRVASQRSHEPPPYVATDVGFDVPFDATLTEGDPKATLVLYEFSDYECQFCRKFAAETASRIEKEYVRPGRLLLVFRDQPMEAIHPRAMDAAAAASCARAQRKFLPMNERLFRDPVALSKEDFARAAHEIGLDESAFRACTEDPATVAAIRRGVKEAGDIGVAGTPMFVLGVRLPGESNVRAIRMIAGAQPWEVFKATLDGLIRARGN